jgi:DNA-directed RNA polymerase subunit beta
MRKYWGKTGLPFPEIDLLSVQRESYNWFLTDGISMALTEISPITDQGHKIWELTFGKHWLEKPVLEPALAFEKGLTYEAPLKAEATLKNLKTNETATEEVFLGDIPVMTQTGTFIISGIERCVVNQLVRSPGVFFSGDVDQSSGRMLYGAELRPIRGSWLEFSVSRNDVITVKIDRGRKFPITVLLKATGFADEKQILDMFKEVNTDKGHDYLRATLGRDHTKSREEALIEFFEKVRPGEPPVLENARELLYQSFFDPKRYDLGEVGRYKLNRRLQFEMPNIHQDQVLTTEDLVEIIRILVNLQNGKGGVDDIDHLANRRVRRVGELVYQTAFRVGLLRLARSISEKMALSKLSEIKSPAALVNARPIIAVVSEFFKRNRLSTILDQTNPLSELDNLRRLSVMGTGGVTKERASFSMRDINSSQYSRICPVRSPEGPNIGLVTYMALYSRINKYGFMEAPYRRVEKVKIGGKTKMKVTDEVIYLQADDEEQYHITHAEIPIDRKGFIDTDWLPMRYQRRYIEGPAEHVELIDVVSRQAVGTSANLIPFIAHDEANRALMSTHMQCQAVPLVLTESPIIGTGMEKTVIKQMRRALFAESDGMVTYVDANKVIIKSAAGEKTYPVVKFSRSVQSTCYSQKPAVTIGDKIKQGQLLIDGPAADQGELALGRNLMIAYASFEGLGYEDSVIVSDRLVKEDLLTSIHINEYEAQVMDTKLGPEELTKDIPNIGEADLANLGENGIVVIGAEVGPNDILVGKIAPKGETELTAEERLLRAIFGEKAKEVRDTSLRTPHGERGTVIEVRFLDRDLGDELDPGVLKKVIIKVAELRKITVGDKLAGRHGNKGVISKIVPAADLPYLADGTPVDIIISPLSVLQRMNMGQLLETHLGWAAQKLGYKVALPVFESVSEDQIITELKKAGLPITGKVRLFDGRTGERFQEETVVGIGYIMKLSHMVEDKLHARSTGPYSLVTQQPLGGKAQMGGQRLGEMEVWALESHRAAHTLQEMLTIKSDDVVGRTRAFEAIVKNEKIPEAMIPESFKVLVKELNSLGLNVIPTRVIEEEKKVIPDQAGPTAKPIRDDNQIEDDSSNDDKSQKTDNDDKKSDIE